MCACARYCAGGELFFHLSRSGRFNEARAKFYTSEILLALEYTSHVKGRFTETLTSGILGRAIVNGQGEGRRPLFVPSPALGRKVSARPGHHLSRPQAGEPPPGHRGAYQAHRFWIVGRNLHCAQRWHHSHEGLCRPAKAVALSISRIAVSRITWSELDFGSCSMRGRGRGRGGGVSVSARSKEGIRDNRSAKSMYIPTWGA
eukprot:gene108-biopygen227